MVLVISQDTFDNAVRENIEDLGMEPEEALQEAVTQFEKQGVNLSNILKELKLSDDHLKHIQEDVAKLKELTETKGAQGEVLQKLEAIKTECDKGIQNRVSVAKEGAYDALIETFKAFNAPSDIEVQKSCLKTLAALMTKQPDLLNDEGINVIIENLKKDVPTDIKKLTLKWVKECGTMHEMNRQKLVEHHIIDSLKTILLDQDPAILKELLLAFRTLVLDDDVRVEFGKAHEHARIISTENLCQLSSLLTSMKYEDTVINDLLFTISTLLVRAEFCKKLKDSGAIDTIGDIMKHYTDDEKVMKQCFKLIKALAGNDECKNYVIHKKLSPVILQGISQNKKNISTVVAGFLCIASLTLRSPPNSQAMFEAGAPAVIVDVMKLHPSEKSVQKTASWAIRNMVSRNRDQNKKFLELGVEEILQDDLKQFKDVEYDIKAALRDLGCNVKFKEEWTGKGGALTTCTMNREEDD